MIATDDRDMETERRSGKDAMLSGNIAETKAFLEDINWCNAQGFTNVNVFTDGLLSSKFSFFSVVEVNCSVSQTAHKLAKAILKGDVAGFVLCL